MNTIAGCLHAMPLLVHFFILPRSHFVTIESKELGNKVVFHSTITKLRPGSGKRTSIQKQSVMQKQTKIRLLVAVPEVGVLVVSKILQSIDRPVLSYHLCFS